MAGDLGSKELQRRAISRTELIHTPREQRGQTSREMSPQVFVRLGLLKDFAGCERVAAVPRVRVWGGGQRELCFVVGLLSKNAGHCDLEKQRGPSADPREFCLQVWLGRGSCEQIPFTNTGSHGLPYWSTDSQRTPPLEPLPENSNCNQRMIACSERAALRGKNCAGN